MFGISAALTTPVTADRSVDTQRYVAHIRQVLDDGCSSVTLFGTTGEGASFSAQTRLATLAAVIDAGIDPGLQILALHGNAVDEVNAQIEAATGLGVRRFLLPPANFYNAPGDDGLFEWFAAILSAGRGAEFILYHIPQVIGVGLSLELVNRLTEAYRDRIIGVKDSSGNFANSEKLIQNTDLAILIGDERQLARAAAIGASGAISGIANIEAGRMLQVLQTATDDPAINRLVNAVLGFPVTPAVKSLVSHRGDDPAWRATLPPLSPLTDGQHADLTATLDRTLTPRSEVA